jgi:hypothetical protein
MYGCLFCGADGPYTTIEHTVPEALGNDDSVLLGEVCDGCQAYLGAKVESFALEKAPIGPLRVLLRLTGKRGKLPLANTSVSERTRGYLPESHAVNDRGITFGVDDDSRVWVALEDPNMVSDIVAGEKTDFRFVLSAKHLAMLGRLLGKMALELLCREDPHEARSARYAELRHFVRFGVRRELWVIAHKQICHWRDLIKPQAGGECETVTCYEFGFYDTAEDRIFAFMFGGEVWAICMDRYMPSEQTRAVLAGECYEPIWYSREEWMLR